MDRLLHSPRYGERMAMAWLDLARYADTHGYHIDSDREMWHWRDWVIDAFNSNMPFDQFTVEQLAGDLLPNATIEQKIATGFNRNHMINFEGGAIPEEYQNEYLVDRVETTSATLDGSDDGLRAMPRSQVRSDLAEGFLPLLRVLQLRFPKKGLDGQRGNAEPFLQLPSEDQQAPAGRIEEGALPSWIRSSMRRRLQPTPGSMGEGNALAHADRAHARRPGSAL